MKQLYILPLLLFASLDSYAEPKAAEGPKRTPQEMVVALQAWYDANGDPTKPAKVSLNGKSAIWVKAGKQTSMYASQVLIPGDPAPKLEALSWLNTTGPEKAPVTEGQVVMIDFSATWCGPCVASMPHVEEVHKKFKDRGLVVVIATDEPESTFAPFAKKTKLTMPVALKLPRKNVREQFGVTGWPSMMLVDRKGTIVYVGRPLDENLEAIIEKLLAAEPKK